MGVYYKVYSSSTGAKVCDSVVYHVAASDSTLIAVYYNPTKTSISCYATSSTRSYSHIFALDLTTFNYAKHYIMYFSADTSFPGGSVTDKIVVNPSFYYSSFYGYYAYKTTAAFTSKLYWCAQPSKISCAISQSYTFNALPPGKALFLVFYDDGLIAVNSSGLSPTAAPTVAPTRSAFSLKEAAHEVIGTVLSGTNAFGVAYNDGKFSVAAVQQASRLSAYATGTYSIDKVNRAG
jgi:hypothetical protein